MTLLWPQPLWLFCLWSDGGEDEGGTESGRGGGGAGTVSLWSEREIPAQPQRAMTCLITFMFDWVQGSLKLAWRKWDFPSQNITLHPSSKPSITVLYILPLCQFYRSHQALSRLTSSPTRCGDLTKIIRQDIMMIAFLESQWNPCSELTLWCWASACSRTPQNKHSSLIIHVAT